MKRGQETAIAIGVAIGAGLLLATRGPRAPESVPKGMGFMEGHSGKDYMRSLGERPSAARETGILEAVRQGFIVPITWVALTFQRAGHEVTIQAASDSLRVGSTLGDAVRVSCSHKTAQQIADLTGAILPTTLLSDVAWLMAQTVLPPLPTPSDAKMNATSRMLDYSDVVDAAAARQGHVEGSLVRTVGKDWVSTERLLERDGSVARPKASSIGPSGSSEPAGANFGWHLKSAGSRSPGGQPVIQSVGLAHDWNHVDYSQTVQLYGARCTIDGAERSVIEVLRDPASAFLLSDEVREGTACRVTRHPAVAPPGA